MPSATVSLDASTASAAEARHFTRSTLDGAGWDTESAERVELLVSEVVTNAVLHARSGPKVTIDLTTDVVRITVEDYSPLPPIVRDTPPDASGGRGMVLVDLLSNDWGTAPVDGGKSVWFVVER